MADATTENTPIKASIVLVHGAWADASSWSKVIPLLRRDGIEVLTVHNPLTSLADDVAATRRVLSVAQAPVVLVGHSWAGTVITEAGNADNVAALVYVSAFAPDAGQTGEELIGAYHPAPGALDGHRRFARLCASYRAGRDRKLRSGPSRGRSARAVRNAGPAVRNHVQGRTDQGSLAFETVVVRGLGQRPRGLAADGTGFRRADEREDHGAGIRTPRPALASRRCGCRHRRGRRLAARSGVMIPAGRRPTVAGRFGPDRTTTEICKAAYRPATKAADRRVRWASSALSAEPRSQVTTAQNSAFVQEFSVMPMASVGIAIYGAPGRFLQENNRCR